MGKRVFLSWFICMGIALIAVLAFDLNNPYAFITGLFSGAIGVMIGIAWDRAQEEV